MSTVLSGTRASSNKIESLQILRAVAAMLVVVNHVWGLIERHAEGWQLFNALRLDAIGGFGVDIFFCLSGFIMVMCLKPGPSSLRAGIAFIAARVRRIYPIYWFWLLLTAPILWWVGRHAPHLARSHSAVVDGWVILRNALLVPSLPSEIDYRMLLPQTWTLVYEMYFYVLFAACLAVLPRRHLVPGLTALMFGILLGAHLLIGTSERNGWVNLTYMVGDPLTLNFLAGAVYATVFWRIRSSSLCERSWFSPVMLATCIVLFVVAYYGLEGPRIVKFGLPSVGILVAASLCSMGDHRLSRWLVRLGDASYSIYISHILVAWAAAVIAPRLPVPMWVSFLMFVTASVILGLISYSLIESPISGWLNRRRRGPGALPLETVGSGAVLSAKTVGDAL